MSIYKRMLEQMASQGAIYPPAPPKPEDLTLEALMFKAWEMQKQLDLFEKPSVIYLSPKAFEALQSLCK